MKKTRTINNGAPIGIFDSGIGGLTVAEAIIRSFPEESVLYVGDTAHLPYGEKSVEAIEAYALGIVDFLYREGCKMIIVACNSASSVAYPVLKKNWGKVLPIINVIDPLVKHVSKQTFRKVGVIATKATIRSDVYAKKILALKKDLEVVSLATSLLAPMIEEGFFNQTISKVVINKYLSYPDFKDIGALLLACTHYPLIRKEIEAYFEGKVQVLDSIEPVVEKVGEKLDVVGRAMETKCSSLVNRYQFFVSDYTSAFEKAATVFCGKNIELKKIYWNNRKLEKKSTKNKLPAILYS